MIGADGIYALLRGRHGDFSAADLQRELGADATVEGVGAGLAELVADGRAVELPDGSYLSDIAAQRVRDTARRVARDFHRRFPFRLRMPLEALEAPLQKAAAVRSLPNLVSWLVSEGVLAADDTGGVRLPEHTVQLPPSWQDAADAILAVYAAAGLYPPSPDGFEANYRRDIHVPTILEFLVERGDLVHLAPGVYVSAIAISAAKEAIRGLVGSPEGMTVGAVRHATGSSRRVLLPLLEHLDRRGFTRRVGEHRVLV